MPRVKDTTKADRRAAQHFRKAKELRAVETVEDHLKAGKLIRRGMRLRMAAIGHGMIGNRYR